MYSIYALVDPRDETVRYIGMSRKVEQRYNEHLRGYTRNYRRRWQAKNLWLEELYKVDITPSLKIIETVLTIEQAKEREKYWIRHYSETTDLLTNVQESKGYKIGLLPEIGVSIYFFYDATDAAYWTGISYKTIIKHIRSGVLRAKRGSRGGGGYAILSSDLIEYAQNYKDSQQS